jgi:phosphatidylcholine synthase
MSTTQIITHPRLLRKALAWGVHLFTATGAVWGLLALVAIHNHQWKVSFLWMIIAILVDGFDGSLARVVQTKKYAPEIDGALLDNLIDYLNYVIVPAMFFYEARLLPAPFTLLGPSLIVLASAYQFSQSDAKTSDNYFKGFPSFWNILVLYLFVIGFTPWFNLGVLIFCCILVFIPVKYIYPSRSRFLQNLSLVLTCLWGILGVVGLLLYPNVPAWIIWASLSYIIFYVIASIYATLKNR